jgi:hypothetical protein
MVRIKVDASVTTDKKKNDTTTRDPVKAPMKEVDRAIIVMEPNLEDKRKRLLLEMDDAGTMTATDSEGSPCKEPLVAPPAVQPATVTLRRKKAAKPGSSGEESVSLAEDAESILCLDSDEGEKDEAVLLPAQPDKASSAESTVETPWFCYLMKQLGSKSKNEANIRIATNPFADLESHNRGDANDKATKTAKGSWQIEMIVGPFSAMEPAEEFRKEWMTSSRGLESRRTRAFELVERDRAKEGSATLTCFDKRLVPRDLGAYLSATELTELSVETLKFDHLLASLGKA